MMLSLSGCIHVMTIAAVLAALGIQHRRINRLEDEMDGWTRYVIRNGDAIDRGREL